MKRLVATHQAHLRRFPNLLTYLQGNTIVVLKALGQENIDDLLKLSEDYKKSELPSPLFIIPTWQQLTIFIHYRRA